MKLIIDIDEETYKMCKQLLGDADGIERAIANGKPFFDDITDEQISAAFQLAIASYWEEKSKYLTPPTPCDCPNFVSSPTEVVKVGGPLSNSDEISKALEKGDIYRRGFEDGVKKVLPERPQGEWVVDKDNHGFSFKKCSVCNEEAEWLDDGSQFLSAYCPNCGAKMYKEAK